MNPIVFYQTGGAGYVGEAVRCLRRFVPIDRIWLISDRDYVPGVRRFDVSGFNSAFGEIDRRYVAVPGQPNPPEFEKLCFKRWFALRDLMLMTGVDRVFSADSDTLICCDPFTSPHISPLTQVALTQCELTGCAAASITFQSKQSIMNFCDFVLNRIAGMPGTNDMVMWNSWVQETVDEPTLLNTVVDSQVWDHNIGVTAGGYEKNADIDCKYLFNEGGVPFTIKDGVKVRMLSIHCWNGFKNMMADLNFFMERTA